MTQGDPSAGFAVILAILAGAALIAGCIWLAGAIKRSIARAIADELRRGDR